MTRCTEHRAIFWMVLFVAVVNVLSAVGNLAQVFARAEVTQELEELKQRMLVLEQERVTNTPQHKRQPLQRAQPKTKE